MRLYASGLVLEFGLLLMFFLSVYAVWIWSIGGFDKYFNATGGFLFIPMGIGCLIGLVLGGAGSFWYVIFVLCEDEKAEENKRERVLNQDSCYSSFTLGNDYE